MFYNIFLISGNFPLLPFRQFTKQHFHRFETSSKFKMIMNRIIGAPRDLKGGQGEGGYGTSTILSDSNHALSLISRRSYPIESRVEGETLAFSASA